MATIAREDTTRIGRVDARRFPEPQHPDFVPEVETYVDPDGNLERLAYAFEQGQDVLISGPTGVGKTSLVRQLCALTNRAYRRFPCSEATDTAALIGKPWLDGESMVFQRGIAYDAVYEGHVLLLDEWSLAHADVQLALNPLFAVDEGMLIVPENEGEIIPRPEDFRLVATTNPSDYAGVKAWSPAAMSRFDLVIEVKHLPPDSEAALLTSQVDVSDEIAIAMAKAGGALRDAQSDRSIRLEVSYRELRNWAHASITFGVSDAFELAIVGKAEPGDAQTVRELAQAQFAAEAWS